MSLMMMLTIATPIFSQEDKRKWFAIYLLPKNIKASGLAKLDLKKIKPTGKPLIHQHDILTYNQDTHEFSFLLDEAKQIEKFKLNLRFRTFAVFVGNEAIYVGAFWTSLSSQSFDGITINLNKLNQIPSNLTIELGYPTAKFFKGQDLRSDARILQAFQQVNKLYEALELIAKCKNIKPTYKHLPSQVFTFEIIKVTKGSFVNNEIKFELGFYDNRNEAGRLAKDLRKEDLPDTTENLWKFDDEKEIMLKIMQQIGGEYPKQHLIDWKVIKK